MTLVVGGLLRPAPCGPPLRGLLRPRPHIRASRALQMWAAGRPPLGFGCGPRIGPGPPAKSRPAGGWTGGCSTVRRFFRPRRGRSLVPSKPPEKGRPDALARARRQRPQDLVEGPGSLQPPRDPSSPRGLAAPPAPPRARAALAQRFGMRAQAGGAPERQALAPQVGGAASAKSGLALGQD